MPHPHLKTPHPPKGITLSNKQVERGTQLAKERGLSNVTFKVMDALAMQFDDDSFDLVWACESGEHMPDKKKYVEEMTRVLAPGEWGWGVRGAAWGLEAASCLSDRGSECSDIFPPPSLACCTPDSQPHPPPQPQPQLHPRRPHGDRVLVPARGDPREAAV